MKNIVLITVDCLRADAVGCYGNAQPTTPHIDDLATDGRQFNNCFATAGSTKFSFPALLGSIYFDMYEGNRFPRSVPLLSEVFADAGYATAGFNAANPNLTPEFGYSMGFNEFDDYISANCEDEDDDGNRKRVSGVSSPTEQEQTENLTGFVQSIRSIPVIYSVARAGYQLVKYRIPNPYRKLRNYTRYIRGRTPNALSEHITPPATEIVDRGINAASQAVADDQRFFLWLHLMEPHSWYNPDPEYVEALYGEVIPRSVRFRANRALMSASPFHGAPDIDAVEEQLKVLKKLYNGSIRQADAAIGELMKWLSVNDLDDQTAVVVTADHGEEFLEHGSVQHGGDVHSELTRVPLVVRNPDGEAGRSEIICSLIDVPTTVASLAGVEFPSAYLGRDLLDPAKQQSRRAAISANSDTETRIAARDERYTLVRSANHPDRIFDRRDDPFEQHPLEMDRPAVEGLGADLEDWRATIDETSIESATVEPSGTVSQQLEDLGYLE